MDEQGQEDQLEPIYDSFVLIQDIALNTSQKRWTIESGGERGLRKSVQAASHDDDDDDDDDCIKKFTFFYLFSPYYLLSGSGPWGLNSELWYYNHRVHFLAYYFVGEKKSRFLNIISVICLMGGPFCTSTINVDWFLIFVTLISFLSSPDFCNRMHFFSCQTAKCRSFPIIFENKLDINADNKNRMK